MAEVKDLTTGSITSRISSLAAPLIAASFVQMAYSMTDMAWLGHLSSKHVAAVGAASFIIWFCNSTSFISRIGAEISISQSLGRGSREEARSYAEHAIYLSCIVSLAVAVLVFIISPLFIGFFKLENDISAMGIDYLRIIAPGIFFTCNNNTFGGVFFGSGNSKTPFKIASIGLIANMILDPLLIFGYLGFPAMGTNGAALATTLSQLLVFSIFSYQLYTHRSPLGKLSVHFKKHKKKISQIARLGTPVSVQNMIFATLSTTLAQLAARFGHVGVAVFSIGSQIEAISWMTAGGFSTALGSFVGQNFGAKKYGRIVKGYQISMLLAGGIGLAAGLAFFFAGDMIFSLFVTEPETYHVGGVYLHILALSQVFMVMETVTAGAFNGLGRTSIPALLSIVLNACRIPMAYGLVTFAILGVTGIWWSITISSILKGTILTLWFYYAIIRKYKHY